MMSMGAPLPVCLGIDYGLERAGLAISRGQLVLPAGTLALRQFGNRKAMLDAIAGAACERGAQAVVIGLPLHEDGSESVTCAQTRNVTGRLKRRMPLPFYFMPETLSSFEAEAELRQRGLRGSRLAAAIDQAAACHILRSFLAQPRDRWMPA